MMMSTPCPIDFLKSTMLNQGILSSSSDMILLLISGNQHLFLDHLYLFDMTLDSLTLLVRLVNHRMST